MRQKLAFVVCGPPFVTLRRMNGFSPVRMTLFGSAGIAVPPSIWVSVAAINSAPAARTPSRDAAARPPRRIVVGARQATAAVIVAGDYIGAAITRKFAAEGFTVF